jgi:DNA-binding transcriptional ArsR family regulator
MNVGPDIAATAALLGDPKRAALIELLFGGEAYPASVLAARAGISAQTASVHLAKLSSSGLVASARNGRHRLYGLSNQTVAAAIEALAAISIVQPIQSLRQSDELKALRLARMCYDHIAGIVGVRITEELLRRGTISRQDDGFILTLRGCSRITKFGVDVDTIAKSRRKVATQCLDWSERRPHVGGALGAALADRMLSADWFARRRANRSLIVTDVGWAALRHGFGIERAVGGADAAP